MKACTEVWDIALSHSCSSSYRWGPSLYCAAPGWGGFWRQTYCCLAYRQSHLLTIVAHLVGPETRGLLVRVLQCWSIEVWPESWISGHPKMTELCEGGHDPLYLKIHIDTQGELASPHTLWWARVGWGTAPILLVTLPISHKPSSYSLTNGMGWCKPHPHSTFHVA
jgi:hypothetical protein